MIVADEAAMLALGTALGRVAQAGDVLALDGPLGAGKTVLARGILRGLGHHGEVPSPTFPIVLQYDPPAVRLPVWHADLYRIEGPDELAELGLDEAEAGVLIAEWPDRLPPRLLGRALRLAIAVEGEGARRLTPALPPAWEARWPLR